MPTSSRRRHERSSIRRDEHLKPFALQLLELAGERNNDPAFLSSMAGAELDRWAMWARRYSGKGTDSHHYEPSAAAQDLARGAEAQIERIRALVERGGPEVSEAVLLTIASTDLLEALHLEFGMAQMLGGASKQAEVRRENGRSRGRRLTAEAEARRAEWQREADRIWAVNPTLSKNRVGQMLVRHFPNDAARTIRGGIVKKVGE